MALNGTLAWSPSLICPACSLSSATIFYLPLFVLGAVCASRFHRIRNWMSAFTGVQRTYGWLAACCFYSVNSMLGHFAVNASRLHFTLCQVSGLGAAGIILAVSSFAGASSLLNRGVFQFLGRTSYSFYLSPFCVNSFNSSCSLHENQFFHFVLAGLTSRFLRDSRYVLRVGGKARHSFRIFGGSAIRAGERKAVVSGAARGGGCATSLGLSGRPEIRKPAALVEEPSLSVAGPASN